MASRPESWVVPWDSLQTLLGCISRVQQCLSPRRNWDSPSPESECVPSPEPKGVGTLACEWGGGGFPIPTRRQTLLYSRYVCASSLWMCVPPSPLNSVKSKIMTNLCPWNSENPCKWHPPPPPTHTCLCEGVGEPQSGRLERKLGTLSTL